MTHRRSLIASLPTPTLAVGNMLKPVRLFRLDRRNADAPRIRRGALCTGALAWLVSAVLTGCVHAEATRSAAAHAPASLTSMAGGVPADHASLIDTGAATAATSPPTPSGGVPLPSSSRRRILADIVAKCGMSQDHQPCLIYDAAGDDVLLKDIRGQAQFLLLPISAISGIESPALLRADARSYFYEAWNQRRYVIAALHKPLHDTEIGLAINPINARSQDHLHIHIDCVRGDVRDALATAAISANWSDLSLGGGTWQVRRVPVGSLRTGNLFRMVAREIPGAAADMGRQTIFVTGAPSAVPGTVDATDVYIAVRRVARPLFSGPNAEELLDHACGVASQRPIGPSARPVMHQSLNEARTCKAPRSSNRTCT